MKIHSMMLTEIAFPLAKHVITVHPSHAGLNQPKCWVRGTPEERPTNTEESLKQNNWIAGIYMDIEIDRNKMD